MKTILSFACVVFAYTAYTSTQFAQKEIPYPEGFRNWRYVKTNLTGFANKQQRRFDGFHIIYANEKAVIGYRTNHYPDGSMIVFDKHEVDTTSSSIQPGKRKYIDVMYRDSLAYLDTGGWGFQEFPAASKTERLLNKTIQQQCFSCHASQKAKVFIFSEFKQ